MRPARQIEQLAVIVDSDFHASNAQRIPQRSLVCGEYRPTEILFQRFDHADGPVLLEVGNSFLVEVVGEARGVNQRDSLCLHRPEARDCRRSGHENRDAIRMLFNTTDEFLALRSCRGDNYLLPMRR
jgi:hypothetical protein